MFKELKITGSDDEKRDQLKSLFKRTSNSTGFMSLAYGANPHQAAYGPILQKFFYYNSSNKPSPVPYEYLSPKGLIAALAFAIM